MDVTIGNLRKSYASGEIKPVQVVDWVLQRLADADQENVWISTVQPELALKAARDLDHRLDEIEQLPLYGTVFSVKDNIDVAGEPTTAACPGFSYIAEKSAFVVDEAINAGAIYIGKTNMDQFATGLVGTRSPYGTPRNPHNPDYLPGGSSSGAAVSIATGTVSFGFGTDTGGSGRVPACYNGVVGLKPAPGTMSRQGLVYACQSFDTPSIYAANIDDAMAVFNVTATHDPADPWSIENRPAGADCPPQKLRVAVPRDQDLEFFGSRETEALYRQALPLLPPVVGSVTATDYSPFHEIGQMMFFGPFVAERYASVGDFIEEEPGKCDATVRDVILGSKEFTASDAYQATYRLKQIEADLKIFWEQYDVMMVPTVGRLYTRGEVAADPFGPSYNHGYYTNFANPLELAALAVPFGHISAGVPYGVTFLAPAGREKLIACIAASFIAASSKTVQKLSASTL